uniref:Uncharacterized protein n=1 Tax=Knipowitschia caucasica TaxID=637954 RepID=A0AAV2KXM7_KNICA
MRPVPLPGLINAADHPWSLPPPLNLQITPGPGASPVLKVEWKALCVAILGRDGTLLKLPQTTTLGLNLVA